MKKLISMTFAACLSLPVLAEKFAITGATVHTLAQKGSLENATVLIQDGKILDVVDNNGDLTGFEVIDGTGKVVTPGLIGAYTSLGLVEVELSAGTVDSVSQETSLSSVGAALDATYALNPDSSLMAISRIEGITSAASGLTRTKQLFSGQGAFISLAPESDIVIKPKAFISTAVSRSGANNVGGSRAALWVMLNQALEETSLADKNKITPVSEWHGLLRYADLQALKPILDGSTPLLIDARSAADIRQVIALKKRHPKLNLAVLHATEGWRVADELARNDIAVILNPEANLPNDFDQLGATLKNAQRLHAAGVTIAIGIETHNIRLNRQHAGNAVAYGLPWEAGLRALTLGPAAIYNVDSQVGSLEPGKRADVVIWSGDPLEVTEIAEQVFINGEKVEMESRQTKLRDRYLKRDAAKPAGYTRP